MAITEEERREMFEGLRESIGPERAATLMAHLPPVGWADVATKRDLDALALATTRDLDALGERLHAEIDGLGERLHAEIEGLGGTLHAEIDGLGGTLHAEIEGLGGTLHAEIEGLGGTLRGEFYREQRNLVFAMLAANSTLAALAFAAARLV